MSLEALRVYYDNGEREMSFAEKLTSGEKETLSTISTIALVPAAQN